jgi:Uma2 family endonuclease
MLQRLTRSAFQRWTDTPSRGRFERIEGEVVARTPERWAHAWVKARIWRALDREITQARLQCEAAPAGMTVEIDDHTDYKPDALVNCGTPIPDDATAAPNPIVIVEVVSPATASVDAGAKLADYFRLASVRHYLQVRPTRREIIHHRRVEDGSQTRIVREGVFLLDPPGIRIDLNDIYGT